MATITAIPTEETSSLLPPNHGHGHALSLPDGRSIEILAEDGVVDAHRHDRHSPFNAARDVLGVGEVPAGRLDEFVRAVSDNEQALGSPRDVEFVQFSSSVYAAALVGPWRHDHAPVGMTREEAAVAYAPLNLEGRAIPDADDRVLLRSTLPRQSAVPSVEIKRLMYGRLVWDSPAGLIAFEPMLNAFAFHRHDGDSAYNAYRSVPWLATVSRSARQYFQDEGFAVIRPHLSRPEFYASEEVEEIHPARIITERGIVMPLVGSWRHDASTILGQRSQDVLYGREPLCVGLSPGYGCNPFADARDYSLLQTIRDTMPPELKLRRS